VFYIAIAALCLLIVTTIFAVLAAFRHEIR
jgi:hypothetical protein